MKVEFSDKDLDRLEVDANFNGGHSRQIVKLYRKRMQAIRAANDLRPLYAMKSLHFEKLSGDRQHQRSLRLNNQWRLIVEVIEADSETVVRIVEIVDYH
ncbi:MAG: type II toxin-antitoxin system RelE/ParE family toxin [Pirellulales bacterium]